jgi:hypothetical protein
MKYQIPLQIPSIYISLRKKKLNRITPNYVVYTEDFRAAVRILQKARLPDGTCLGCLLQEAFRQLLTFACSCSTAAIYVKASQAILTHSFSQTISLCLTEKS